MIPKILLQTSKYEYPQYVKDMWTQRIDSSWTIEWFDDDKIIKFFNDNPLPEFPNIVNVFHSFKEGAHKADLFRYYYLYLNGGFFIDSDVMTHVHMNEIYSSDYDHLLTYADIACNRKCHPNIDSPVIFNGLMGCVPKSKIIYEALLNAYTIKPKFLDAERLYFVYMLYVISEKYKKQYNIKYYSEYLDSVDSKCAYAMDGDKKISTHFFTDSKIIPSEVDFSGEKK